MSRAAERLHVAPTAVSLQVKAMEDSLGVALLERHSRGVHPTAPGHDLFARAREILRLVEQTERDVAATADAAPRCLRLGVAPSVARVIGVAAVIGRDVRKDGFVLRLTEGWSGDLVRKLDLGKLDFIIARGDFPEAELHAVDLMHERLVFVTAPAAARPAGRVPLAEALASDVVIYARNGVSHRALKTAADRIGQPINVVHEVASLDVMRLIVGRGHGTAFTPFASVLDAARHGEVAVHEIDGPPVCLTTRLACRAEDFEAGRANGFIDDIIDTVQRAHVALGPYYTPLVAPWRRAAPAAS